jgi:hypothetical protein
VPAVDLIKFFEVGESVRILQGIHSGAAGQVIELVEPELKHAMLLMENTRSEVRVFVSNLRRKEDNDPNPTHILSQTLLKQDEEYTAIDKKATFSPGDLILFDNYKSIGLVLKV